MPVRNPYAYGNAWYVDKVSFVANANEELDGIKNRNLRHEAVADQSFKDVLGESMMQDSSAVVNIVSYEPNQLTYKAESKAGGVIVFSEIFYPGWTATIDGKSAELGRVNYVLRALKVAPGSHDIVLEFRPQSIRTTETVAYASSAILLVGVIAAIFTFLRKRKKKTEA